jgi:gluconolactonase
MFFDANGNLLACADEKNELWSITPDGNHTILAKEFEGKALNGPNDVWVRADGSLYFTDPFYKRPWWDHNEPPQGTQQVYFLSADRKTLKRATTDLAQPNGIIGTPDGKTLFVADIRARKTYAYDIQADGSLANRRLHCELGSDGMTLIPRATYSPARASSCSTRQGNGSRTLTCRRPDGQRCAGGKDHKTLFITASTGRTDPDGTSRANGAETVALLPTSPVRRR